MKPFRAYWEIIRCTPGLYATNAFLQILRSCLPLLPALIVMAVMDRLTSHARFDSGLAWLLALMVGAVLARVAALMVSVSVDATSSSYASGLMLRNCVDRILRKPGAQGLAHSTGDVVNRLTADTAAISDMLMNSLVVVGSAAQAVIALAVLFSVAPLITCVVAVPLIAAGFLINMTSNRIKRFHSQNRQAAGEVNAFLREVFSAAQAIQLAGAQTHVSTRFREVNEVRRRRSLQSRIFTVVFLSSIWTTTSALGTGIVLIMAAGRFETGSFTVGDLALFIAYLGWITEFTALFSQNLASYKQAAVSVERLVAALPEPASPDQLVERHRIRPDRDPVLTEHVEPVRLELLEVRGLTYRHAGSGRGVSGADLTVGRGEFVVVTGPVGSGKTTLLRTVLGLLKAQEGVVSWNGAEIADLAAFFVPPHSAYAPQVPHLSSATVRENVLSGLDVTAEQLESAVDSAVLEQDLKQLDLGLDTPVGPRGTKLSGGQAQRVAAARMFVRRPELLVFDDLSSALDATTEEQLWDRLFLNPESTCLVVSHRRAALRHASRIIVLKDGLIECTGTYDELMASNPEFRELWAHGEGVDLDGD